MDQSTVNVIPPVDNHYVTREFLENQLVQNKERIAQLEELQTNITQRSYTEAAERNRMRNEVQEWTLEELENGQLTESQAEELAEICGFELTKEFEVEVTVTYSMTINAKHEQEATEFAENIDFETIQYSDENISWLNVADVSVNI